ncbi:Protein FAM173B [Blattella germanica]|nr:Protein FAM173B [Blattella germanica]
MENQIEMTSSNSKSKSSKAGIFLVGLSGGAAVAVSVICLPFVSPALRRICLPYVPATTTQIRNVMSALAGRSGKLVDLGSGDGRIVLAAAKNGFLADGVDLNPWLIVYSRLQAYRLGLGRYTRFYLVDLWKFNLQPYPNIVVFGVEEMVNIYD